MLCPKEHGTMVLYEDGALKKRYLCKSCDLKLELDTNTGKVVQVAGALAVVTGISLAVFSIFFGGGGNDSGGQS